MNESGKKIIIFGCGNMGSALLRGLSRGGKYTVIGVEKDSARLAVLKEEGYSVYSCPPEEKPDYIILAVKPAGMNDLALLLGSYVEAYPDAVLVSIAAGIRISSIREMFGKPRGPVIRVMPNTPALVGQAVSAVSADAGIPGDIRSGLEDIFSSLGYVFFTEEEHMDAVTAVSGSGPAYVFHLAELLDAYAQKNGIDGPTARDMAVMTIKGAAALMEKSGRPFALLKKDVMSPGGTTEAALSYMDDEGFGNIFSSALERARRRSEEISQER